MAVDTTTERPTAAPSTTDRTVHVSAYVDLSIADLVARVSMADVDDLFTAAARAGLGAGSGAALTVHVSRPVPVSERSVRMGLSWSAGGGPLADHGDAVLSLLAVRSGNLPVTELLVALPVPAVHARSAAAALHGMLDALTAALSATLS